MIKVKEKELKEIFNQIKNHENSAFEKLYNKYNTLVYGIAFSILKNKQDAEDVAQTVFAKIYDIDSNPVKIRKWTQLDCVRVYRDFFNENDYAFDN